DQLGQFVLEHVENAGAKLFAGSAHAVVPCHRELALDVFPFLRGRISAAERMIGSFSDAPEVLRFVNSQDAERLAFLGTSCPDHFIRTKIRPLFVGWTPSSDVAALKERIDLELGRYRREYRKYYEGFAEPSSPKMRDASPTVVLVPGVGMFSFGKTKTEA